MRHHRQEKPEPEDDDAGRATLRLRSRTAEAYLAIGELSAAQAVLEQTVAHFIRVSGPAHPSTQRALRDLANAKRARRRHDEQASSLLKRLQPS